MPRNAAKVIWQMPSREDAAPARSGKGIMADAMACGMAIRVGHIREVLAKIKAAGGRVLSRNGELVEWSDTIRNVFVKDPNGLNLELVGTPPGVPAVPFPGTQPGRGRGATQ